MVSEIEYGDGLVVRRKPSEDARRMLVSLTTAGHQCFLSMSKGMELNYAAIQEQFGEERLQQLMALLGDLKQIKP